MTQRPLFATILLTIGLFIAGGILLSFLLGILSSLLWLGLKLLLPLALIIWFVRLLSGSTNRRNYR